MADTVSVKSPRDETKPRRRWGRWLVLLIIIVAVAAALYGFFGRGGGATGQRTLVELVERGTFVRDISGTGTVEAAQTRTLTFGTVAGGAGTVAELNVAEGDEVQAGAVLARLDTASLERDLASAQANLQSARAEAQRVAAQQEADRLDTSSGAASAEDTLTNAQQTLRNAQQKLATTERLAQTGAVSNNEVQADRDAVAQAERGREVRHRLPCKGRPITPRQLRSTRLRPTRQQPSERRLVRDQRRQLTGATRRGAARRAPCGHAQPH